VQQDLRRVFGVRTASGFLSSRFAARDFAAGGGVAARGFCKCVDLVLEPRPGKNVTCGCVQSERDEVTIKRQIGLKKDEYFVDGKHVS
jgi:hypothetical protein